MINVCLGPLTASWRRQMALSAGSWAVISLWPAQTPFGCTITWVSPPSIYVSYILTSRCKPLQQRGPGGFCYIIMLYFTFHVYPRIIVLPLPTLALAQRDGLAAAAATSTAINTTTGATIVI